MTLGALEMTLWNTVFTGGLVVAHGEVGLVATLGDVVVFEGFEDGTTGFVGVGAVGEAAVFCKAEDLGEVAGEFFGGHVEGAEAFDARGVDEPGESRRGSEEISRLRSR